MTHSVSCIFKLGLGGGMLCRRNGLKDRCSLWKTGGWDITGRGRESRGRRNVDRLWPGRRRGGIIPGLRLGRRRWRNITRLRLGGLRRAKNYPRGSGGSRGRLPLIGQVIRSRRGIRRSAHGGDGIRQVTRSGAGQSTGAVAKAAGVFESRRLAAIDRTSGS
jgi:hypothetical protein